MVTASSDVLEAARALRERLVPGDLDATLAAITAAAVEVLPGVHHASLGLRHPDGTLASYAVTDPVVRQLDECQFSLREGPCYDGTTRTPYVASPDLAHDPRYPRYGPFAADLGVRSSAGLRLYETPHAVAALNLFSHDLGRFDDSQDLSLLFAHQAAIALSYSMEIDGLNQALQSRKRIGQALGILMERYQLPEEHAFAFLTRLSQQGNVKLRRIAEELVAATPGR